MSSSPASSPSSSESVTSLDDYFRQQTSPFSWVHPPHSSLPSLRPSLPLLSPLFSSSHEPLHESCLFKAALNGVMGAGLGVVWGVFMTSMTVGAPLSLSSQQLDDMSGLSLREQMRRTGRDMWKAAKSSGKSFGFIGALYTVTECSIEKSRGCHRTSNAVAAGCLTGGALACRGGPQAMILGCVGFAAFGLIIDRFMTSG